MTVVDGQTKFNLTLPLVGPYNRTGGPYNLSFPHGTSLEVCLTEGNPPYYPTWDEREAHSKFLDGAAAWSRR